MDVGEVRIEDGAATFLRGTFREAIGVDELAHRSAVYGEGSADAAFGNTLLVQLHDFEVAGVTLLAACSLLGLLPGGEHRLGTFG